MKDYCASSVLTIKLQKKCLKTLLMMEKRDLLFVYVGVRGIRKIPSPLPPQKKTVRDYLQNRTKFSGHQNFATRCEINAREISKTLRKHFDVLTASNSYWLYWLEQFRCFLKRLSVI